MLDYEIELPAFDNKRSVTCTDVRIHLHDVVELSDGCCCCWRFSIIAWQTYCKAFDDYISHYLYDVSLTSNNDLLGVIEQVKNIISECS